MSNSKSIAGKKSLRSVYDLSKWKQKNQQTKQLVPWKGKIDKTLAQLTERKPQINKIRDEMETIITDTNEIQKIINSYLENIYSNKLEICKKEKEWIFIYIQSTKIKLRWELI